MLTRDHHLIGIRAKIERTDEHIRNLDSEINALINGDSYALISKPNDDATKRIISITGPEPPLRFAVIAGEIAHQLRSVLDHLVWELVINNKNTPGRYHQYPICDTSKKFKAACDRGYIRGISDSAKAIIESRQPYSNSKDVRRNFLYVLRELNNTDKHKLLVILATNIAKLQKIGISSNTPTNKKENESNNVNIISIYPGIGIQRPTEKGTEILRIEFDKPEPNFKALGKPILQIVFGDFGPMTEQPIIYILSQVREKVVRLIDSFESEIY